MKLYAPKYYKKFACIADKCRHSCCIGWEIDIDENTLKKYTDSTSAYSAVIRDSIDTEETPHFRLANYERCPHLNESGLCNIILELGEDFLCDICREHPRFYNDSPLGKEVGLGIVCEEACRIVLDSDNYGELVPIGDVCGKALPFELDTLRHRRKIYAILSDTSLTYPEKLLRIYREFNISRSSLSDVKAHGLIESFEYLDEAHRERFRAYSSDLSTPQELEKPLTRALAYFVFRHCTEAYDENEYRASLGMCLFCERLLASVAKRENIRSTNELIPAAQMISEEIEYSEINTEAIKLEFLLEL